MLNLIIGIISIILQAAVLYYAYKMYKILNPVRYWTTAWLFFSAGNFLILLRRGISLFPLCGFTWVILLDCVLQVAVSVFLFLFVRKLHLLYSKYFVNGNGPNILSWDDEQEQEQEKNKK